MDVEQQTRPLTNARGEPLSALIVEDESYVALILRDALTDLGCQVSGWALSWADAERLAANTPPDVAVIDIRIKGERDGVEVAKQLRARHGVAVVFVTGLGDEHVLRRVQEVDNAGLVRKPFDLDDLRRAMLAACGGMRQGTVPR